MQADRGTTKHDFWPEQLGRCRFREKQAEGMVDRLGSQEICFEQAECETTTGKPARDIKSAAGWEEPEGEAEARASNTNVPVMDGFNLLSHRSG